MVLTFYALGFRVEHRSLFPFQLFAVVVAETSSWKCVLHQKRLLEMVLAQFHILEDSFAEIIKGRYNVRGKYMHNLVKDTVIIEAGYSTSLTNNVAKK